MALFFDLTQPTGEVSRIELKPGSQRLRVLAGDRYRIIDEQGNTPDGLVIRRYDNHLLVDNERTGTHVELTDYYGRCSISAPCVLELGGADGSVVQITPASEPVRAMTDGSFVLYQSGSGSGGVAPLAAPTETGDWDSGGGVNGWLIGGGVLGLLAVAGLAGGGGGGSDSPVAVNPSPPAPTPPAPPPPAPPPAGDTTPPEAPQVTSATVSNQPHPVLSGKAEPASTVQASYDLNGDGQPDVVYRTSAAADGSFTVDLATARPFSGTLPPGGLPDGRVAVSVVAIDPSNNTSQPHTFNIEINATPPDAPRITGVSDNVGAVTGPIANSGTTDDLTPTLSGSLARPLGTGERLVIVRNGVEIASLTSVSGTTWSYEDSGLALNQTYVYEARVTNAVGNASSTSNGWQIQTRADPPAPLPTAQVTAIVDDAPRNTGTIASGGVTNDRTPTLNGQLSAELSAGQTVQILRNGALTTLQASVTGTRFSVTDTLTTDGTYTYSVRVVQTGGATGTASPAYSMVLDTTNTKTAAIGTITDNVAPGTGTIANGATTNDTTPTLTGTVSAALTAGERLEIVRDGQVVEVLASTPGGRWSWSDSGLVVGETYSYTVRVVDAAGNVGRDGTAYRIRIVATAREETPAEPVDPTAPVVTDPTDPADPTNPGTPADPATPVNGATVQMPMLAMTVSPTTAWLLPGSGAATAEAPAVQAESAAGTPTPAASPSAAITLAELTGVGTVEGSAGPVGDVSATGLQTVAAMDRLLETA